MLLNSFVSNCAAFRSDSVDAATVANRKLLCPRVLKVVIQSSVIGNPFWTAFVNVLRHSRITDIISIPVLRNSFENPAVTGSLVRVLVVSPLELEAGSVSTI